MAETESAAAKAKRRKQEERIFLVVVDKSEEMRVALRYASLRAKATGGRVALFTAIEPADSHTWQAVGELMEEELRTEAEAMMQRFAEEVVKLSGKTPVIYIRPGVGRDALLQLVERREAPGRQARGGRQRIQFTRQEDFLARARVGEKGRDLVCPETRRRRLQLPYRVV